ncbi:MAG: hypothetical protein M3T55_01825 [Pseudomonadota bacterium]|nr:hypothetical protein [Pseudomonadota bacterium]
MTDTGRLMVSERQASNVKVIPLVQRSGAATTMSWAVDPLVTDTLAEASRA